MDYLTETQIPTDNLTSHHPRVWPRLYGGQILKPWADAIGLDVDKFVFLFCVLLSVGFGVIMSTVLSPKWTSPTIRHLYSGLTGFAMIVFCFGAPTIHLIIMMVTSYLMLTFVSPRKVQTYLFFFCMLYLSVLHLIRMYTDYGAFNLDITAPMMIMVAKMSGLGFSIYDGRGKSPEKVRAHHQELKLVHLPSVIEFFSYGFSFLTSFAGPFCFFVEYNNFINGRPLRREYTEDTRRIPHPLVSASRTIGKKAIETVFCCAAYMYLMPRFDMHSLLDPQWLEENTVTFKVVYITVVGIMERTKYYIAWLLIDIACNCAGFGFRGINPKTGHARWDAVVNVRIRDIEFGPNIRTLMNAWNIGIVTWLRYVVYDRVKFAPVIMTYFYSALWHGFYPGYYLAFVTMGLYISCARWGRRKVRPYFLNNAAAKVCYDIFTFIITRATITYCAPPFVLLGWWPTFVFYRSVYFFGHILGLIAYILLPYVPSSPNAVETNDADGDKPKTSKRQQAAPVAADALPDTVRHRGGTKRSAAAEL